MPRKIKQGLLQRQSVPILKHEKDENQHNLNQMIFLLFQSSTAETANIGTLFNYSENEAIDVHCNML